MDPSLDKTTLKKMSLVHITKPFDNTEEATETMSNTDIENAQLVNALGKEHLEDLHRYEGSLYCRSITAGSLMAIGGLNGTYIGDEAISSAEVLSTSCNYPLPEGRYGHISVTTADGNILVCGGETYSKFRASCLKFKSQSK